MTERYISPAIASAAHYATEGPYKGERVIDQLVVDEGITIPVVFFANHPARVGDTQEQHRMQHALEAQYPNLEFFILNALDHSNTTREEVMLHASVDTPNGPKVSSWIKQTPEALEYIREKHARTIAKHSVRTRP